MKMETILILSVAINVIVLIVFFVMASNIAKIRQRLENPPLIDIIHEADMEKYAGNKEKARELYLKVKYRIDILKEKNYNSDGKVIPGLSTTDLNNKIEELSK
ncbi:MAG: hypothetical protein BHW64_04930 [Candidatus Melainabacteria bacterium LEY3_CP_29_8]|nr:MAG: hypothetical protein BHW64_04930 [Candidatus Melainabacteria bacterium LEY3_CP_29_8]